MPWPCTTSAARYEICVTCQQALGPQGALMRLMPLEIYSQGHMNSGGAVAPGDSFDSLASDQTGCRRSTQR